MYDYVAEFKRKVKLTKPVKNVLDFKRVAQSAKRPLPRGFEKIEYKRKPSLANKYAYTPSEYNPLRKRLPYNYGGSSRTRRIRDLYQNTYPSDY